MRKLRFKTMRKFRNFSTLLYNFGNIFTCIEVQVVFAKLVLRLK